MIQRVGIMLLVVCYGLRSVPTYATDRIGILISKKSVLSFESDILDVDIDVDDYFLKIKGTSLLIRAKRASAPAATLFVRYGKERTCYVAEIFPDDEAPLHRIIQPQDATQGLMNPSKPSDNNELTSHTGLFTPDEKQQYTWFAVHEGRVTVMVTHIKHSGKNTYIRIYINNQATVGLSLSHCSFEYITKLKKWLFFTSKQSNRVTPILAPSSLALEPLQAGYFDFAIPIYTSNGGLDITLGESENGMRKYTIHIPTQILLEAPRK